MSKGKKLAVRRDRVLVLVGQLGALTGRKTGFGGRSLEVNVESVFQLLSFALIGIGRTLL